jgi:Coenzyme PQQ synthesis protein D (PqqD)
MTLISDRKTYVKRVRLDMKQTSDGCIFHDEDAGVAHFLNFTAAAVLELCDGNNDVVGIAEILKAQTNLPEAPIDDVRDCIRKLENLGFVAEAPADAGASAPQRPSLLKAIRNLLPF